MSKFIGLEITKNIVRFASIESQGQTITLNKYDEVIADGNLYKPAASKKVNLLTEKLTKLAKDHHFKQEKVTYCDFGYNLLIQNMVMTDRLNKERVKERLFLELGSSIPIPFDDVTFDVLSMREVSKEGPQDEKKKTSKSINKELDVNYVVANEKDLVYVGDAIVASKNIPYAVDMSALAYQRLLTHFSVPKIKRGMYLLLELNCGEAVMTVMHRGIPIYTQYAEYNPDHWKVKLEAEKASSWVEQWFFDDVYETNKLLSSIDSINRLVNTFSNGAYGAGIKNIVLVGENPLIEKGLTSFLSEHIEVPIVRPKLAIVDKYGEEVPIRYYKAVGLAMKKEELK